MGFWRDLFIGPEANAPVIQTRSETPPEVIPPRSTSVVSDSTLLHTIPVYRAVNILTTGASQLTLDVTRGSESLPTPALVRKPDPDIDLSRFLKQTVASMALTGNAYWRIYRDAQGRPAIVRPLNPHDCTPRNDGTLSIAGQNEPLPATEFRHLGLLFVPGSAKALGPIQAARAELTGAYDVIKYGAEFFSTGDVPSGTLTTDEELSPAEAAAYRAQWHNRNAHEIAVLGHNLKYTPILLSPEDAQFLQTRQFDKTAIATLFGVPAHLMLAAVEGSSMTYTNVAQADLSFVRWSLMDYLREIETAFTAILPGSQTARFNIDGITRPDIQTRYEAHKVALEAGFLSVNDVRRIEGLPPISGGDTYGKAATA